MISDGNKVTVIDFFKLTILNLNDFMKKKFEC